MVKWSVIALLIGDVIAVIVSIFILIQITYGSESSGRVYFFGVCWFLNLDFNRGVGQGGIFKDGEQKYFSERKISKRSVQKDAPE